MKRIKLPLDGMHCASCAQIIEMRLKERKGIKSISVSSKNKTAEIEFDENKTSETEIKNTITKLGYKVD